MADLLTTATLAKWTQNDPLEVAADEFAVDLITKLSELICYIGGHDGTKVDEDGEVIPEWGLTTGVGDLIPAPIDVQMVMLQVAKRSYENPGQVIQEGSIGPIGGDRVADTQALFMDFTEAERAAVAGHNPDGDPLETGSGVATLFTIATLRDPDDEKPSTARLYVSDNQQTNIESTNAYPSWDIPMFSPGDPGDPALYDEG